MEEPKACPKCKEPHGLGYCENCHGPRRDLQTTRVLSTVDWRDQVARIWGVTPETIKKRIKRVKARRVIHGPVSDRQDVEAGAGEVPAPRPGGRVG